MSGPPRCGMPTEKRILGPEIRSREHEKTRQSRKKQPMSSARIVEQIDDISYEIRRTRNAKRISLRIADDGRVWVSMPPRVPLREAREFVREHVGKIREHLDAGRKRRDRILDEKEALRLPYKGAWYAVELLSDEGPEMVRLPRDDEHLIIRVAADVPEEDRRRLAIVQWQNRMIDAANRELPQRTVELANRHELLVRRIRIRDQRSRWGSCSKANKSVNLNWRCVLFPDDVRDYLILHELAHLLHADHSVDFWNQVGEWCADYRRCDNWITAHGPRLMEVTRVL